MGTCMAQDTPRLEQVVPSYVAVLTSERKEITVEPSILEQHVGTYELAPRFSIVMTAENGQLKTQGTGQPKLPVFAKSENKFLPKAGIKK